MENKGRFTVGHKRLVTHGKARTSIYRCWSGFKARCENPKHTAFKNYGGRGIFVCERWQKFENFYADMGDRPDGLTLDRIDNNGPYSPENCRWANKKTQSRNRRNVRIIEARGEAKLLHEWSEEFSVPEETIRARLKKGWEPDKAVSYPVRKSARWHSPSKATNGESNETHN